MTNGLNTETLLQDLEKRDAQAEKKRESIMVNFNQTKGQLSSMDHAMKSLQVDLEKTQFALEVKKGDLLSNMASETPISSLTPANVRVAKEALERRLNRAMLIKCD